MTEHDRDKPTPDRRPISAAVLLGLELRRRRMALGLSQVSVVRSIGLSAHSNLSTYEKGARIPPLDVTIQLESVLRAKPGSLVRLRDDALVERANEETERLLLGLRARTSERRR